MPSQLVFQSKGGNKLMHFLLKELRLVAEFMLFMYELSPMYPICRWSCPAGQVALFICCSFYFYFGEVCPGASPAI